MPALSVYVHLFIGLVLLLSHALFFFRALAMRRKETGPKRFDRILRAMSHWGLPLVLISGLIASNRTGQQAPNIYLPVHILLGLTPFFAIMVFALLRPLKVRIPWLLPAINLLLFILAVVSGLMAHSH